MPRKTIYIRDEDLPIFERARRELDAPIGTIVIRALQNALAEKNELWHKAFCLQMIRLADMPILNELVDHRLQDMPEDIRQETGRLARLAVRYDPRLIDASWCDSHPQPLDAILYGSGYADEAFAIALEAARKAERFIEETRRAWLLAADQRADFPKYPVKGIASLRELTGYSAEILRAVIEAGGKQLIDLLMNAIRDGEGGDSAPELGPLAECGVEGGREDENEDGC